MKSVLITGANSYIGTNVERWLLKEPEKYHVETLDMKDPNWVNFDFSKFDVVFHVAGIAHSTPKKSEKDLYYRVNTQLTIDTANIAKKAGVKQFIFMSSMIVYSSKERVITKDTKPNPDNFYGDSKLQAEIGLNKLSDKTFKIVLLRPPMIYGPNSKGNFPRLMSFARKSFIFPNFKNKRSMLYIDNLSNSIKYLIDSEVEGLFFPQNSEYMCTSEIVRETAKYLKKKIWFTKLFNPFIHLLRNRLTIINKVFSDSYYDLSISSNVINNNVVNNINSIINCINVK
ncbi:MAG: NAD-dependent epimerase/dehydratase family protein [Bacilli bacterium]